MPRLHGLSKVVAGRSLLLLLAVALLLPGCPAQTQSDEALRKEVQELKKEVTALKDQVNQLQTGQKELQDLLKKPSPLAAPPAAAPEGLAPQAPQVPHPLTVGELLANKDRYVGTRVTVRGAVGPVLVHRKSLLLKAPEGMVEVFFGKLPDEKQVQRLTSMPMEGPLTVTGVVSPASSKGGANLQITAEAVEF